MKVKAKIINCSLTSYEQEAKYLFKYSVSIKRLFCKECKIRELSRCSDCRRQTEARGRWQDEYHGEFTINVHELSEDIIKARLTKEIQDEFDATRSQFDVIQRHHDNIVKFGTAGTAWLGKTVEINVN